MVFTGLGSMAQAGLLNIGFSVLVLQWISMIFKSHSIIKYDIVFNNQNLILRTFLGELHVQLIAKANIIGLTVLANYCDSRAL